MSRSTLNSPHDIDALVAEIGSTTTVVSAFDGLNGDAARAGGSAASPTASPTAASGPSLLGQGVAKTTVTEGDVRLGVDEARAALESEIGPLEPDLVLATSSAAGGLRMTVHGLTEKMTAMAAREAALGAGGVVELQTSGKLRDTDLAAIDAARPGLVLLAGGVEGGDTETVLFNAERLTRLEARPIVVYAGNSSVAEEARELMEAAGLRVRTAANVYPGVDELDVGPARAVIHDAFEEHITHAPGMEGIAGWATGRILPTPGAVLLAAEALAEEIGDLVVIDVGGATTDVHSVTTGSAELAEIADGPQPHAKRTVEGDLGTYVSASHAAALLPESERPDPLPPALPDSAQQVDAAVAIARRAAVVAIERHAGRLAHLYTPTGRKTIARGRDLTACRHVIGTGGALSRLPGGEQTLQSLRGPSGGGERLLPPHDARIALDRDYVFACCGALLAHFPRHAVVALMRGSIGL